MILLLQLFERRKKYLKGKEEEEKWATIDANFMTEESEAEDGETFRQHQLQWRSEGLYALSAIITNVHQTFGGGVPIYTCCKRTQFTAIKV